MSVSQRQYAFLDGNGKLLPPGAEAAVAPGDEKELGAAVGVEAGVPLRAVLSPGDIGQPGGAAGKAIPFLRNFLEILLSLHFALISRGYHASL